MGYRYLGPRKRLYLDDKYKLRMYCYRMASKTRTVNISFRDDVARAESRSRSELVREAARLYIERKKRMTAIIESMRAIAADRGLTEEDVRVEIESYRREKAAHT